jgi:hypothetical protein
MPDPRLDQVKALRRECTQLRKNADRISAIADRIEQEYMAAANVVDGPTAVQMIRERVEVGHCAHYRTFYELLAATGVIPRGEKPLATLLSAMSRSEHFRGEGRTGRYERVS